MAIPFLGLGLGDLAKIGADAYNAKSLGEHEAERLMKEDEDRKDRRRREQLQASLTALQLDNTRVDGERRREELDRIRRGLTPVPQEDPIIGYGARDWETYKKRLAEAQDITDNDGNLSLGSRDPNDFNEFMRRTEEYLSLQERYQGLGDRASPSATTRRDNEPPTLNEVQDASNEIVQQMMAGNPLITADQVSELVSSEEGLNELSPAMRLLVEGGQVNKATITSAWQRINAARIQQDAMFQQLKGTIDEACQAGIPTNEIRSDLRQNPNYSRYEEPLRAYLGTLSCGQTNVRP